MVAVPASRLRLVLFTALLLVGRENLVVAQQPPEAAASFRWWHGLVAVGAYGLLTTFDDNIQSFVRDNRSETGNRVASVARRMGQPEVFATVGLGVLMSGVISGDRGLREAGARISTSLVLAGGVVTIAKYVAGRSRPSRLENDADDFQPFSGNSSAPSGHTAMAFALATSLSDEIHHTWASIGLYTAAGATAWSRVNDNAHWASDVLAGAAVGIVSAKFINGRIRLFGMRSPLVRPAPGGIALTWSGQF